MFGIVSWFWRIGVEDEREYCESALLMFFEWLLCG